MRPTWGSVLLQPKRSSRRRPCYFLSWHGQQWQPLAISCCLCSRWDARHYVNTSFSAKQLGLQAVEDVLGSREETPGCSWVIPFWQVTPCTLLRFAQMAWAYQVLNLSSLARRCWASSFCKLCLHYIVKEQYVFMEVMNKFTYFHTSFLGFIKIPHSTFQPIHPGTIALCMYEQQTRLRLGT